MARTRPQHTAWILSLALGVMGLSSLARAETPNFHRAVLATLATAATQTTEAAADTPPPSLALDALCNLDDPIEWRVFRDYGAMFVAGNGSVRPARCAFQTEEGVAAFQAAVPTRTATVSGIRITLQEPAMNALLAAQAEARAAHLRITPADAHVAARRTFADTERLWRRYVGEALAAWVTRGRIRAAEALTAANAP